MEKVKFTVGGFVGINEGNIYNCYTALNLITKRKTGEFCYRNEGNITQCFSKNVDNKTKRAKAFCLRNKGKVEDYFYADDEKIKASIPERINIETLQQKMNWDFQNVWNIGKNNKVESIVFNERTFKENIPQEGNVVAIKNADELFDFARKVNKGYERYRNAHVILKNNIDLKGKKWTPIGIDQYNSFKGKFDGNGHTIENFKIYQDKLNFVGFFGYVQGGIICNLKIDCICRGKRCIGAMAGVNDGGYISCCKVITNINSGETTGGFVGRNTGEINKCCVMGKIMPSAKIFILLRNLIIGAILIGLVILGVNKYYKEQVFVPVAIDPNAVVDVTQEEEFDGKETDNKASFDFVQTVVVDSSNMIGTLDFRNPKRGNHNIVVKILISDKELKEKLGKTGRDNEKQENIEKTEGYNEETYMTEIYHSGLIERGYKLPNIQLTDLEDGTKMTQGNYNAKVSLEFYKEDTNEKAIVNTELPITLIIK